jgi:hypothetical protein
MVNNIGFYTTPHTRYKNKQKLRYSDLNFGHVFSSTVNKIVLQTQIIFENSFLVDIPVTLKWGLY